MRARMIRLTCYKVAQVLYVAMNLEENDTGETPGEVERQGRDFVQRRRVSFLTVQQVNKTLDVELDPVSDTRTVQLSSDPATVTAASPKHDRKDVGEQYYKGRRRSSVAPLVVERFTRTRERRWSVSFSSIVAAIPAILFGITISFPSNAILDLTGEATELPPHYFVLLSTQSRSIFAALAPLGAIFGGPIGGWIADRWGRKSAMMFCGVPYLIGYMILSYAHYAPTATAFKTVLFTGRFVSGVGMGWVSSVAPVYTGELSSPKLRGIFINIFPTFLVFGVLLNYIVGAINGFRYYYTSLVAVGLVALFEVLMFWLPDTPRWLLSRGYGEEAENVLLWLRGKKIGIKKELDEMKASLVAKKGEEKKVWKLFLKRNVAVPVMYTLVLFTIQQGCGINAITPFAGLLFSDAGIDSPRTTSIYAVGISGIVGLIISIVAVDVLGRKFLLVTGGTGAFLAATGLGIHFFITRPSLCNSTAVEASFEPCNLQYQMLATVSVIVFVVAFNIGYNTVPYVLLSELLPLSVRGVASGIAAVAAWITATLFTGFYLEFAELVRPWFAMWSLAAINVASVLFVILLIPETKGKSLEEMENKFVGKPDIVETIL